MFSAVVLYLCYCLLFVLFVCLLSCNLRWELREWTTFSSLIFCFGKEPEKGTKTTAASCFYLPTHKEMIILIKIRLTSRLIFFLFFLFLCFFFSLNCNFDNQYTHITHSTMKPIHVLSQIRITPINIWRRRRRRRKRKKEIEKIRIFVLLFSR